MTNLSVINNDLMSELQPALQSFTSVDTLKHKVGRGFIATIGGQEFTLESAQPQIVIVGWRQNPHRVFYAQRYDQSAEKQAAPDCTSNNGSTPTEWSQPIMDKDGVRVLMCAKCPKVRRDVNNPDAPVCSSRRIAYVVVKEFPNNILEFDMPPGVVFSKESNGVMGFDAYTTHMRTFAQTLAYPHVPGSKASLMTVFTQLKTTKTKTGANTFGFSHEVTSQGKTGISFVPLEMLQDISNAIATSDIKERLKKDIYFAPKAAVLEEEYVGEQAVTHDDDFDFI